MCSCGVMHCLFKADNPKRERERDGEGGGVEEGGGGRERKREKWEPIRGSGCRYTLFCDTLWWRARGWQRWRERGAPVDREREREIEIKAKRETEEERGG